jgi:hypothetical protein
MLNISLNVGLSQPVESNELSFDDIDGVLVVELGPAGTNTTLLDADIKKNGVSVGLSTTIANYDSIKITGTSAHSHSTPSFASLLVQDRFITTYACMTVQIDSDRIWGSLDPTESFSYTPAPNSGRLHKVNADNSVSIMPETAVGFADSSYLIMSRYLDDQLVHYSVADQTAHTMSVQRPWAVTYSPTETPSQNINTHVIVARHAIDTQLNSVAIFSGINGQLLFEYDSPDNTKVMAVAGCTSASDTSFRFWMACFDGKVYLMEFDTNFNTMTIVFTCDIGNVRIPNHISVSNNDAYVSTPTQGGNHAVVKLSYADGSATVFPVDGIPMQSAFRGTDLYICLQDKSQVAVLRNSTISYVGVIPNPTHCLVINDFLYVGSANVGNLVKYTVNSPLVLSAPTTIGNFYRILGMVADGDSVYVSNAYADMPITASYLDRSPNNLSAGQQNVITSALNQTASITLEGIENPSNIHVPIMYNAGLSKNGIGHKTSESYVNGDVFKLSYTHNTLPIDVYIPIVWDRGVSVWILDYVPPTSNSGGTVPVRIGGRIKG